MSVKLKDSWHKKKRKKKEKQEEEGDPRKEDWLEFTFVIYSIVKSFLKKKKNL